MIRDAMLEFERDGAMFRVVLRCVKDERPLRIAAMATPEAMEKLHDALYDLVIDPSTSRRSARIDLLQGGEENRDG